MSEQQPHAKRGRVEHKSAATVLRDSVVSTGLLNPKAEALMMALPTSIQSEILGLLSWRENVAMSQTTPRLQCIPITSRTVLLDQEHWPLVVADSPLLDDDGPKALAKHLHPFRATARRLVVSVLGDQWRQPTQLASSKTERDALRATLHAELPSIEEVELETLTRFGERAIPLATFMPAKPSKLKRLMLRCDRLDLGASWLQDWITWSTENKQTGVFASAGWDIEHKYTGPLEAFGCMVSNEQQLATLLKQWRAWGETNRPTELELRSPSSYSPRVDSPRDDFPLDRFCASLDLWPKLRRLRLSVLMHYRQSQTILSRLLLALSEAKRAHMRLHELQLHVEGVSDRQVLYERDGRLLSECVELKILSIDVSDVLIATTPERGDDPGDVKMRVGGESVHAWLDALNGLEHVRLRSKTLRDLRTRPWPNLVTIEGLANGGADWPDDIRHDLQRLVPTTHTTFGQASVNHPDWTTALPWRTTVWTRVSASSSFHSSSSTLVDEKHAAVRVREYQSWIQTAPQLERFGLTLFNNTSVTIPLGDAFLAAWSLAPIPAAAAKHAEPSRPVRPLHTLSLRCTYHARIEWSIDAVTRFCTACPLLEYVRVEVPELVIQPDTVRAWIRRLPRLLILHLANIPRLSETITLWDAMMDEWIDSRRSPKHLRLEFTTRHASRRSSDSVGYPSWPAGQAFVIQPVYAFLNARS